MQSSVTAFFQLKIKRFQVQQQFQRFEYDMNLDDKENVKISDLKNISQALKITNYFNPLSSNLPGKR